MEIIDVSHLYAQNKLDKIREIYFEEIESMSSKEEWNEIFKDSWVLVEKKQYVIKIFLFDWDGHKIRFTQNQEFKLELDTNFKVIS